MDRHLPGNPTPDRDEWKDDISNARALTQTYVGFMGGSAYYARTNFYADEAARIIPKMFELFDNAAAEAFADYVRTESTIKERMLTPAKLTRVRALGAILLDRVSSTSSAKAFLEVLTDESRAAELSATLYPQAG